MPGKRQQIVDAVKARFALITTANGYQTDIGLKQTEWSPGPRGADPEAEELPGHDIRDEDEATHIENKNAGVYERQLEIVALGYVKESSDGAVTARKALEDMIKAVGVDPTWGAWRGARCPTRRASPLTSWGSAWALLISSSKSSTAAARGRREV